MSRVYANKAWQFSVTSRSPGSVRSSEVSIKAPAGIVMKLWCLLVVVAARIEDVTLTFALR